MISLNEKPNPFIPLFSALILALQGIFQWEYVVNNNLKSHTFTQNHPVYYAGPAKTPDGYASGSFGPTTAGRMDSYVDMLMKHGASMIMLAKGNRSNPVRQACGEHGGFYLGTIGGAAARLAQDAIKKVEVIDFPELGMEAVHKIEIENFPAFVVINDKGEDFYAGVSEKVVALEK